MKQFNFLSPTFFGLVVLSFFLTFFDIKCKTESFATATGIELMTGKIVEKPEIGKGFDELQKEFDADKSEKFVEKTSKTKENLQIEPNPFAMMAFALGLIGIGLFFLSNKKSSFISSFIVGIVGVMFMIILKVNLETQFNEKLPGLIETGDYSIVAENKLGYYLAISFFVLAAIWNILSLVLQKETPEITSRNSSIQDDVVI
jgi:hypothetical protein